MTSSTTPILKTFDLRADFRKEVFDAFVRLYNDTFTEPSEREDPAEWPERLRGESSVQSALAHLLIASPDTGGSEIAGGLLFEYFPNSASGLLDYLVVAPNWRRKGIARKLIEGSRKILRIDASSYGTQLKAVFAEVESPDFTAPPGSIPPGERWAFFAMLGAKLIDIPYVQPALSDNGQRAYHLRLLAFPENQSGYLDRETIQGFLREYFGVQGVDDPDKDPDVARMLNCMDDRVPLKDLTVRTSNA